MIQAKCVTKYRDKNNEIIGYLLIDLNGNKIIFGKQTPEDIENPQRTIKVLKAAIDAKHINIVNLTLTSDNRLVDASEEDINKQLESISKVVQQQQQKTQPEVKLPDASKFILPGAKYTAGKFKTENKLLSALNIRAKYTGVNFVMTGVEDFMGYVCCDTWKMIVDKQKNPSIPLYFFKTVRDGKPDDKQFVVVLIRENDDADDKIAATMYGYDAKLDGDFDNKFSIAALNKKASTLTDKDILGFADRIIGALCGMKDCKPLDKVNKDILIGMANSFQINVNEPMTYEGKYAGLLFKDRDKDKALGAAYLENSPSNSGPCFATNSVILPLDKLTSSALYERIEAVCRNTYIDEFDRGNYVMTRRLVNSKIKDTGYEIIYNEARGRIQTFYIKDKTRNDIHRYAMFELSVYDSSAEITASGHFYICSKELPTSALPYINRSCMSSYTNGGYARIADCTYIFYECKDREKCESLRSDSYVGIDIYGNIWRGYKPIKNILGDDSLLNKRQREEDEQENKERLYWKQRLEQQRREELLAKFIYANNLETYTDRNGGFSSDNLKKIRKDYLEGKLIDESIKNVVSIESVLSRTMKRIVTDENGSKRDKDGKVLTKDVENCVGLVVKNCGERPIEITTVKGYQNHDVVYGDKLIINVGDTATLRLDEVALNTHTSFRDTGRKFRIADVVVYYDKPCENDESLERYLRKCQIRTFDGKRVAEVFPTINITEKTGEQVGGMEIVRIKAEYADRFWDYGNDAEQKAANRQMLLENQKEQTNKQESDAERRAARKKMQLEALRAAINEQESNTAKDIEVLNALVFGDKGSIVEVEKAVGVRGEPGYIPHRVAPMGVTVGYIIKNVSATHANIGVNAGGKAVELKYGETITLDKMDFISLLSRPEYGHNAANGRLRRLTAKDAEIAFNYTFVFDSGSVVDRIIQVGVKTEDGKWKLADEYKETLERFVISYREWKQKQKEQQ